MALSVDVQRRLLEERYSSKMRSAFQLAREVSYVPNRQVPFLRLFRYKEAFSYNLVFNLLKAFGADPEKDAVLDPFSGMGTAPFTAGTLSLRAYGVDLFPLAVFISQIISSFPGSRLDWLPEAVEEIAQKYLSIEPAPIAENLRIISLAFDENTLLRLRKIKAAIAQFDDERRRVLFFLFLSVLEQCSYTSKDGQFLRVKKDKKLVDPIEALRRKAREALEDAERAKGLKGFGEDFVRPRFYLADARELSHLDFPKSPTIIITSPPYANRYDYSRSYALELAFGFAEDAEEIKRIRHSLIRSHIESRLRDDDVPPHPAVEEVIAALREKDLNNPKIPDMLLGYFADMDKVIREWARVLERGAWVAMVVDNVRFAGEIVPVDLILSDMAREYGFSVERILIARYKGNSSQQMAKFGRVPVRESVLIWRKENG